MQSLLSDGMMAASRTTRAVLTNVVTIVVTTGLGMEIEFEWDEEKRLSNIEKHGVDFEDAFPVFDGQPVLTVPDLRNIEERYKTVADVGPRFITVVWTPRDQRVRLISARRSSRAERRAYRASYNERAERENSPR